MRITSAILRYNMYDVNVIITVLDLQIFYHNARIKHSGERMKNDWIRKYTVLLCSE